MSSNLWNDPMGLRLLPCNRIKVENPEAPPPPPPPPAVYQFYCHNAYYPPQPIFQQNIMIPHGHYTHHCTASCCQPAPPAPPAHVCVACTESNKCKKCIKKENESKTYKITPTFGQPRTPRKGRFER